MNILCDTRQQAGKHNHKDEYFARCGDNTMRTKLPFGDYCSPPPISVDTKQNIYELAQDIDQEHERFKAEIVKARDFNCRLIILVENEENVSNLDDLAGWNESKKHFKMRQIKNPRARMIAGARLAKACRTIEIRYGCKFEFCRPEDAGKRIRELLKDGRKDNIL